MVWLWRESLRGRLALYCSLGVASAAGCSGKVDSGPQVPEDAAGGSQGTGAGGALGRGGSGASGRGGSGGSAGRGGASGSGGGGTSGRDAGGIGGMDCQPSFDDSRCFECAKVNCCVEFINCGRDASCFRGQELFCITSCVSGTVNDGGIADDATLLRCASNCAAEGTIVSSATSDVIACLWNGERVDGSVGTDCFVECFAE